MPEGRRQTGSRTEEATRLRDEDRASCTVLSRDWSTEGVSRQRHQRNVAGNQELCGTILLNFKDRIFR